MSRPGWLRYAVCADRERVPNPDIMFPNVTAQDVVNAAVRICASCPVMWDCLEAALAEEDGLAKGSLFGIRGGHTADERRKIAQRRQWSRQGATESRPGGRKPAPCGTPAAYDRHCRLGEDIDDACRDAHNEKRRGQKARQRATRKKTSA